MLLKDINHHLTESDCDKGNSLSALPYDLVAANEGKSCVPSHDGDREIEGSDDTDVADRIPNLHHKVTWSFRIEHLTVDCSGHAHSHITDVDEFLYFAETFRPDLSHLKRYESTKSILFLS